MATIVTVGDPVSWINGAKSYPVVREDGRVIIVYVYPDGRAFIGRFVRGKGIVQEEVGGGKDAALSLARAELLGRE